MIDINFHTAPLQTALLIIGIVSLTVGISVLRIRNKIRSFQSMNSSTTKGKRRQSK